MRTSELKVGDVLVPDETFTCMEPGTPVVVGEDEHGKFLPCDQGNHYLNGQEVGEMDGTDDDTLVGLTRP